MKKKKFIRKSNRWLGWLEWADKKKQTLSLNLSLIETEIPEPIKKICLSRVWMKVLNHKLSMNICLVTVEIISVVISHNTVFEWIDVYLSWSSITVTNKNNFFFWKRKRNLNGILLNKWVKSLPSKYIWNEIRFKIQGFFFIHSS